MSTIVGIDLSLTCSGIATIADGTITVDTVKSSGRKDASLQDRADRLEVLLHRIIRAAHVADLVVIEGPSFGQARQGGQHDRAGFWWLVVHTLLCLQSEQLQVVEVPPSSRAKYATGKGNASKDAVLAAVVRRYLDVPVSGNDEADALVLAAMGARHLGEPIDDLPLLNVTAMSKVAWPVPAEVPY